MKEGSDYAISAWVYEEWFIKTRQECNNWCESVELGVTITLKNDKPDMRRHKCGGWIFNPKLRKCTLKRFIAKRKKNIVNGVEYFKKGDEAVEGEECVVGMFVSQD